jgi:hypothetical protein
MDCLRLRVNKRCRRDSVVNGVLIEGNITATGGCTR